MPFNGSGTFIRVMNWTNDALANIRIRADRHDQEDDNLAQGLSQCITKDGQTTVTNNLPMANYRHTNVGAAQGVNQYARYDQVQLGKAVWAVAGGTSDAITATYSPNTIEPIDGQLYYVRATAANATTTPTFSPDGQTARTIVKYGNAALSPGDIAGDGHELILRYRLSDTKYELLNPANKKVVYSYGGELTIASGAITVTNVYHTVDTEGDAATDDLETINGGSDGQILVLRTVDSARDVIVKTTGNIVTGGVNDITLANSNTQIVLQYDGLLSKWVVQSATAAQGALADTALQPAAFTGQVLSGLTTSNNSTDATNDIDIASGWSISDDGTTRINLTSSITKRLDAAWAVGSGNGGLDTGSIANTTYHVWLIMRPDTGVVDALFSTSATTPTMPTNYTKKTRIGSIIRVSGAILPFIQTGDFFMKNIAYASIATDFSGAGNRAKSNLSLQIPTGVRLKAIMGVTYSSTTSGASTYTIFDGENPSIGDRLDMYIGSAGVYGNATATCRQYTNTSGQIQYEISSSAGAPPGSSLRTLGWIDSRGK